MPAMKKMKKQGYGGKAFNTNSKVPQASRGNGPKGFQRGSEGGSATMGTGTRPGGAGKAMGTRKGGGGRSY
jgi:hypothetical protein